MIKLSNINKIYTINKNKNIQVNALVNINLSINSNGMIIITGKSGSGKTTFLNLLAALDKPTSGTLEIFNKNMNTISTNNLDFYRKNYMSIIFQEYNLLEDYTVLENIKIACRLQTKNENEINENSLKSLELVDMKDLANRNINTLSGGQKQRISIARAIAKKSKIILCDEPTGNLDSENSKKIFEILKNISNESIVIVATHDLEYANKYADRLITLHDGKIINDANLNSKKETILPLETIYLNNNKKNYNFSIKDYFLNIKHNIKKSLFTNIVVILLLLITTSLTTLFLSLSSYNQDEAFLNTLKSNNQYILPITKYIDYPRESEVIISNKKQIIHGPEIFYEKSDPKDIPNLLKIVDNKANFHLSYFFNKNIQDFSSENIFTDETKFLYEPISFREILAIEDFSSVHINLLYGSKPKETNEILIYDFMANSLIHHNVLKGDIRSLVGQKLIDQQTGLILSISGIIKSDYETYSYIKYGNNKYDFEETYLSSLQTILCTKRLINEIQIENDYSSIIKNYFKNNTTNTFIETTYKKFKSINLNDISLFSYIDNYEEKKGVFIDKKAVAKVLNIKENEVTKEICDKFLLDYNSTYTSYIFDQSIERNYIIALNETILGVTNHNLPNEVLYLYNPNLNNIDGKNLSYRSTYMSLNKDWTINKKILDNFKYIKQTDNFYKENPNYYYEGYTEYSTYNILIQEANYYLINVKNYSKSLTLLLTISTMISLLFFSLNIIKKHNYKIAVLKTLGVSNINISIIFGAQIIFITILSYFLSLPLSFILMHKINYSFVSSINSNLIFFYINLESLLNVLLLILTGVIISIMIPLIILSKKNINSIFINSKK